ncbi:MAG TPA: ribonuclease HII [Candidatus Moranbacteria bacterium]|nr:ribonuclease HII [Candidatus Moranbacteria bacterium]
MEIATFNLEKDLLGQGYHFVIGTDEVGRGPLAGPVVACAVALKEFPKVQPSEKVEPSCDGKMWDLVRDSKMLSEKQREKAFDFIHEHFHVGIGLCDHHTIDRINILEASFLSMKKAIQELRRDMERETQNAKREMRNPEEENQKRSTLHAPRFIILVDGNKKIPNLSMEQMAVIGGDKIVKSISAASIVAKVTRDRMMADFHRKYPQYGLDKHKGYGTMAHMIALEKYGPCEIHRKSFGPVARLANLKK